MKNKKKKTILIAEDEVSLMNALSDKLSREGFDIVKASDGMECLRAFEKCNPDLILLDIVMPKMDGMSVLENLKRDDNKKDIPVIVLTNLSSFEDVQKVVERGAYDYLIKTDWSLEDIVKKIKEKLDVN